MLTDYYGGFCGALLAQQQMNDPQRQQNLYAAKIAAQQACLPSFELGQALYGAGAANREVMHICAYCRTPRKRKDHNCRNCAAFEVL